MDRQDMNFLSKTGTPCSAHQISIAIEEEKAEVKSTLYNIFEKEGRVERKGTIEGQQASLRGLVQGGSSDQG